MSDRPRRARRSRNTATLPSNVSNAHYVGYVEDDESVEAIMKKFEELERIEREIAAQKTKQNENSSTTTADPAVVNDPTSGDLALATSLQQEESSEGLTQEQLEEVFKRTSAFTVKSLARDEIFEDMDDLEMWQVELADANTEVFDEEDDYLYLDDEDWEEEEYGFKRKRGPRGEGREGRRGVDREGIIARYKVIQMRMQDKNGNFFFVKKKVCAIDPSIPAYVRLPPDPIPRAWCQQIKPLEDVKPDLSGSRYFVEDILKCDLTKFGRRFQAIYMDPPFLRPDDPPTEGKITIEEFAKINFAELVPCGFLFIWMEKEWTPHVLKAVDKYGFKYVENFCWIWMNIANRIVREPSRYFNKSKLSLIIFRNEGDIELRHQRNPDCTFELVSPPEPGELTERKPAFMYDVIETMLPQAVYSEKNPNGEGLLELWAKKGTRRKGWTTVVQTKE
ncbi:uncharacterized protein VTP21DRAFT_9905 [Calcarisporiella thermophila]|uniref:uncharacterized protein n=1 Tax=Calcarisporiella thermophila TaxID=911321 RepID=UPI003742C86C